MDEQDKTNSGGSLILCILFIHVKDVVSATTLRRAVAHAVHGGRNRHWEN
jgi:hypothetical protein